MAQPVATLGSGPKVATAWTMASEGLVVDGVGVVAGEGAGVVAEQAGLLHGVVGELREVGFGDAYLTQRARQTGDGGELLHCDGERFGAGCGAAFCMGGR